MMRKRSVVRISVLTSFALCILFNACISTRQQSEILSLKTLTGDSLALQNCRSMCFLSDGRSCICTDDTVYICRFNTVELSLPIPGVTSTIESRDRVYFGSRSGLWEWNMHQSVAQQLSLPALREYCPVSALILDQQQQLWIGTNGMGLFRMRDSRIEPMAGASFVSSLCTTPDSSVWVGTNIGLLRIKGNDRVMYDEEISHRGLAIPDNMVEHVEYESSGNVWVFMSHAVSVIKPQEYTAEADHIDIQSFTYIGRDGNSIHRLVEEQIDKVHARWLASDMGLLLLSKVPEESHSDGTELSYREDPNAELQSFRFDNNQSEIRDIVLHQGTLYVVGPSGIWIVPQGKREEWMKHNSLPTAQ